MNNFKIDFIGIGIERSATSWIFKCLKQHPQICGASYKEIDFFNINEKYNQGISFYASYFSDCPDDKLQGEFSPRYFFSPEVPRRIKKHFPETKLICCLRNPIEKTYSLYNMKKSYDSLPHKSFEEFVRDKRYFNRGFYYEPMKRFLELFPRDNVLILIYEEIEKNPRAFMQKIFEFLEVDKDFVPELTTSRYNAVKHKFGFKRGLSIVFSKVKRNFFMKFSWGRKFIFWLEKKGITHQIEHFLIKSSNKTKEKDDMPVEIKEYLYDSFLSNIEKLEKLINKDLSIWKC